MTAVRAGVNIGAVCGQIGEVAPVGRNGRRAERSAGPLDEHVRRRRAVGRHGVNPRESLSARVDRRVGAGEIDRASVARDRDGFDIPVGGDIGGKSVDHARPSAGEPGWLRSTRNKARNLSSR